MGGRKNTTGASYNGKHLQKLKIAIFTNIHWITEEEWQTTGDSFTDVFIANSFVILQRMLQRIIYKNIQLIGMV